MVAPKHFSWSFRDVYIINSDKVIFVAGDDDATKKELPLTWIFRWLGHWDSQPVTLNGIGVTVANFPEANALILGVEGTVIRWGAGPVTEELIDPTDEGPQNYGDLREIRTIGDHAYVVGMRRTVYRCEGKDAWGRIDRGVRCRENDESDAGFNSIDGFSESDIYAVGWDGEIWHHDGKNWKQIESPTNIALYRVVCAENGTVYACGQGGVLLSGRKASWEVIDNDVTDETFWGGIWFRGHLYLSTTNGIYRLNNGLIEQIDIKSKGKKIKVTANNCFYKIHTNGEVLWSVGQKMAIHSTDGVWWEETPYK